jgi:hypothetical protein
MDRVIARSLTGGSLRVFPVNNEIQSCREFNGGVLQETGRQQSVLRVKVLYISANECAIGHFDRASVIYSEGLKSRDLTSLPLHPPEQWESWSPRRSFSHLCNSWVGGTQSSPIAQ